MYKLKRTCWWCGKSLMAISHAEVKTPNGIVWTHKICSKDAAESFIKQTTNIKVEERTNEPEDDISDFQYWNQ